MKGNTKKKKMTKQKQQEKLLKARKKEVRQNLVVQQARIGQQLKSQPVLIQELLKVQVQPVERAVNLRHVLRVKKMKRILWI